MIEEEGDNKVVITFDDWDTDMMALASKLHNLPNPPGETGQKSHEIGIDWLSKLRGGTEAIDALFYIADDFNYCPDCYEVLDLGKRIIKASLEVDALLARRKRERTYLQDIRKRRLKIAPIKTTGKIGFTRGN